MLKFNLEGLDRSFFCVVTWIVFFTKHAGESSIYTFYHSQLFYITADSASTNDKGYPN